MSKAIDRKKEVLALETRLADFEGLPLESKKGVAIETVGEANRLARRSVQEAWIAGGMLRAVKAASKHGEFRPWLEKAGVSKSQAHRFMKLHERVEMSHLGTFDSVSAALANPEKRQEGEKAKERKKEALKQLGFSEKEAEEAALGLFDSVKPEELEALPPDLVKRLERGNRKWIAWFVKKRRGK